VPPAEWLAKIQEPGVRRRAEFYYLQLDVLRVLRQEVRRELLAESKKQPAWKRLCQIPRLVRSGRPYCLASYRLRIVFAPSGSCGLTAVWPSRRK
jgi:hypothetical protein